MTEKSQECGCNCGCNNKSYRYLIIFFLFVIVIILSGIYYSFQSAMAMCQAKSGHCKMMSGSGMPMCPVTHKSMPGAGQ